MNNKNAGAGIALLVAGVAIMATTSIETGIASLAVSIALLATRTRKSNKE